MTAIVRLRNRREVLRQPPSRIVFITFPRAIGRVLQRPIVWHWCPVEKQWSPWGIGKHDIEKRKPLTLSPSLSWPCCGRHGFIKNEIWIDA